MEHVRLLPREYTCEGDVWRSESWREKKYYSFIAVEVIRAVTFRLGLSE
jgi:hypothetical protein